LTIYEFNTLELNERIKAVNQLGTFLDNHVNRTLQPKALEQIK